MQRKSDGSAPERPGPILGGLRAFKGVLLGIAFVSGVINLLMLTGSIFMMQVYDRVLGSHSIPTLWALSAAAVAAYAFQGALDMVRARVLALTGERVDEELGPKLQAAAAELPLVAARPGAETLQPFRDLDTIRAYMAGPGPLALFDIPWTPIYVIALFLLHPLLGEVSLISALVLISLTALAELRGRRPSKTAAEAIGLRNAIAEATQRNAEAVRAMGMRDALSTRWRAAHMTAMEANRSLLFRTGGVSALSKTFRYVLQSAMLGLGAYLAIRGEISAGSIIAGSILSSRALAPIDMAIGAWRSFIASRLAQDRLNRLLASIPSRPKPFELPPPSRLLRAESLYVGSPGSVAPIVKRANFTLEAGQALGVIGPSASGKTTLARALVGAWRTAAGRVLLDGASLDQWDPQRLGEHIGYLPQDVQLFDGTIAENISRFSARPQTGEIIGAAKEAGFHEAVLGFAQGYDTPIGKAGAQLSAGQRQRIGLARALYRRPFLVVLDEPNSNLDAEGEAAVSEAIMGVKRRGGVAVVIAHRPSAIAAVDFLMVMQAGETAAYGPRDEVLGRTVQNAAKIVPLRAMSTSIGAE